MWRNHGDVDVSLTPDTGKVHSHTTRGTFSSTHRLSFLKADIFQPAVRRPSVVHADIGSGP